MARYFAVFVAIAAAALGQDPARQRPQRPPEPRQQTGQKPGAVEGRVTNIAGEPVRKADVILAPLGRGPSQPYAASTDPAGNFRFDDLEPGNYMLTASRPGYVPTGRTRGQRPPQIVVTSGNVTTATTIKLTPQAVITGKVTDEDGDVLQSVNVQVLQRRYFRGRKQMMPVGGGNTNDLGEYRVANIAPGTYYVLVSRSRGPMDRGGVRGAETGYVTTFFPGVTEANQAATLELQAGQERNGVDFRLTKHRVYRIRGKVIDPSPQPGNQHTMVMLLAGDAGIANVFDRHAAAVRDGAFEIFGVPPGSYVLAAMHNRGETRHAARMPVQVTNADVEGVAIQLSEPIQMAGKLKGEGEAAVKVSGVRVELEPASADAISFPGGGTTTEDGGFAVINLSPGRFKVHVPSPPEGTYLKAIKLAGIESPDGFIDLMPGAGPLEVILGTNPGTVTGTVNDAADKALANATVVLFPESSRRQRDYLFKTARTGDDGTFRLAGVAPGDYSLIALIEPDEGSWFDPEFLRTLESKALSVKVAEGSSQSVQIKPQ